MVRNKIVNLPQGRFRWSYCCGDCIFMNLNDRDKWGDCWCGKKRKYYPSSDGVCRDFQDRNRR